MNVNILLSRFKFDLFKIEYVLNFYFSNEEFFESETSLNDFEILGTIGKGGFGTILLAEAEDQKFAIKGLVEISLDNNSCNFFSLKETSYH